MRLVIGGPTRDIVPSSFAMDLARLALFTKEFGPWDVVHLVFEVATYVHVGREAVLKQAQAVGATHILWIDTDMTFPADTAIRLEAHHKPIVACNCLMREPDQPLFTSWRSGLRVRTGPTSVGLEVVDTVGMGVMLMRVDVVADLPRPVFRHGLTDDGGDVGEDVRLCRILTAQGHRLFSDHDVSKEVRHIGLYAFGPDHHPALTV